MAQKTTAKKRAPASTGLSVEEKQAMKALLQERKADKSRAAGEKAVRAAIAEMAPADRVLAERLHAMVTQTAPSLVPRTWYGMPAYAKDDQVICFFKAASKFKERYATFGFNTPARIDEGSMWATSFAVTKLNDSDEAKLAALVRKAVTA